jgi:hypothetical protein
MLIAILNQPTLVPHADAQTMTAGLAAGRTVTRRLSRCCRPHVLAE